MVRFELVTPVSASPGVLFDLSLSVDTHTASMAGSGERAIAGVTSGSLSEGDSVTWRARHFGIPWRLTSRVTACRAPDHFMDEQVSGPFRSWRHAHHFEPDGRGGTVMRDIVEFTAPFGPLGRLAEVLVLRAYMRRLIQRRNAYLKSFAEPGSSVPPGR